MDKKTFQDIVPHRRSIRDIPLSSAPVAKKKPTATVVTKKIKKSPVKIPPAFEESFSTMPDGYMSQVGRPRWGKVLAWMIVLAMLIFAGIYVSGKFHSAVVEVKVREASAPVDLQVKMSKNIADDTLPFELVSMNREETKSVSAQGDKTVSQKATGRVVLYNKNSTAQKLIAQTRLQSSKGMIYRLGATVTIPASKNSVPGSVEASITADVPGAEYNSDLSDFTFPAYKGSSKFEAVYARSKSAITGGFAGTVKVASDADIKVAENELQKTLSAQLVRDVNQQKPDSYILLNNIYSIKYASTTQESKDASVAVKKSGSIVGVLVNTDVLASYVAAHTLKDYSNEPIKIANIGELNFELLSATSTLTANTSELSIRIKGTPRFVYQYDAAKLEKDLAGLARDSFPNVLATYAGIEKGNAEIKPFWYVRFPVDSSKITISEAR